MLYQQRRLFKTHNHGHGTLNSHVVSSLFLHRLSNFGSFVGEQTHATKCKADAALLDRSMKQKKESFGTEVFDKVVMEAEVLTGLKAVMSAAVDKEIAAAVEAAKQQIAVPMNKKDMKKREIDNLDKD